MKRMQGKNSKNKLKNLDPLKTLQLTRSIFSVKVTKKR